MTTPAQYEFSPDQNDIITRLSGSMRELGLFMQVIGGLYGIGALFTMGDAFDDAKAIGGLLVMALTCAFYFLIGTWTSRAAKSFKSVVETTGNDVGHLMSALDQLRKLYKLIVTVLRIMIGVAIIGMNGLIVFFGRLNTG